MAKSRFSRIKESPTKEHIVRLMESEEARKLLQEALEKSGALVKLLEARVKEAEVSHARTHTYWEEDREELNKVRTERDDLNGGIDLLNSKLGGILEERNGLRDRLNRALGWIAHAQGHGPEGPAMDAGQAPYDCGGKMQAADDYMDRRGR